MTEPQTSSPFEWVRFPWGPALRCQPLQAVADHCFTTRKPGLPAGPGTIGDGWHSLGLAFGVPRANVVRLKQVHGHEVVAVGDGLGLTANPADGNWAEADGSMTTAAAVALCVKVADCVPLLLADARSGAVAAVHAGWKGAALGIPGVAVRQLEAHYGTRASDVVAAIGPSIGPCCYRVGAELRSEFVSRGRAPSEVAGWMSEQSPLAPLNEVPGVIPVSANGEPPLWLDMWQVVADQLLAAGLSESNVHAARLCTSCHRETFHSYRVDGPHAGRMVGAIRRRPK